MSKSSECGDSATDKITQSPYSLRSIATTLSEVPVTPTFGKAPSGADRVSVKNRSENSDCMHRSVAELADLPDVAMDLVFAEVLPKKEDSSIFALLHDPCQNLANVPIQPQT